MADPALFPGFKVAWHVPSPSEGDVRERWVDSDTLAYVHVCIDKLDVWKHELNMKRLTVMRIYIYSLQRVLKLQYVCAKKNAKCDF